MPPPQPPKLMEELVEEVLLRFPPDDPANLVRAALVCKLWCHCVAGTAFHGRFRGFHRSRTPLLGVVFTGDCCSLRHDDDTPGQDTDGDASVAKPVRTLPESTAYFVPTTSFRPPAQPTDGRSHWRAIDARHGRVLLHRRDPWPHRPRFSVWDPITDELRDLPELRFNTRCYTAAVACTATAAVGGTGNCDHLDCHGGPFLVVVLVMQLPVMYASVYSSETGAWSQRAEFEGPRFNFFERAPSVLVGSTLYFTFRTSYKIVKYDMATRKVSNKIQLPSKFRLLLKQQPSIVSIVLMTDDIGGLGFVASTDYQLELWSMVDGGDAGFVLTRVIDLVRLLPCRALIDNSPQVSGFADVGASQFLFLRTTDGLYSLEINSSQFNKVANCCGNDKVVLPYVSFCTPTSRVKPQKTWGVARHRSPRSGSTSAWKTQVAGTTFSKSKSDPE